MGFLQRQKIVMFGQNEEIEYEILSMSRSFLEHQSSIMFDQDEEIMSDQDEAGVVTVSQGTG
jgi:hypothetical protein